MRLRNLLVALVLGSALAISGCIAGISNHKDAVIGTAGVTITKPATASQHFGPVEVCMTLNGYTAEPAKNGVNEGKGHHHLLIDDLALPNSNMPLAKDANHVHMGDGSTCKKLDLTPGLHTIKAVFAKGNHVPYNPGVTDTIYVYVGHIN